MKLWIALFVLATSLSSWATTDAVLEESIYYNFQKNILSHNKMKSFAGMTSYEQKLFVDAIEDLAEENSNAALSYLNSDAPVYYDLIQRLRVGILRIKYQRATELSIDLNAEVLNVLQAPQVDLKVIYLLAAYEKELVQAGHTEIVELAKKHPSYYDLGQDQDQFFELKDDVVGDLFHKTPDVTTYMNGEYVKSVKIFMFCRNNRLYSCLMVMKNVHGEPVRLADGTLWSNPALASSARGLPSYSRNGNTPEGIHTIDSVMPVADAPTSFGKFRRMILNFIPKSKDETLIKSLLPESSKNEEWWKNGVVARDIGRSLLRIHGTGKINQDPNTPYFPFMRTSGCIAQRENTYEGITFKDQRDLLDTIMKAMDMVPTYENETNIKGMLFLMEIDDLNAPVTLNDLALRGIE